MSRRGAAVTPRPALPASFSPRRPGRARRVHQDTTDGERPARGTATGPQTPIRDGGRAQTEEDPLDPEEGTTARRLSVVDVVDDEGAPAGERAASPGSTTAETTPRAADPAWPRLQGGTGVGRTEEFEDLRPLLFSIAYRILGSVSEAEDAVQETWLRYETSSTQPRSLKAFLSATVTRISIDTLRSARVQREEYVGHWFPEPLLTDPYEDPARSAELADSLSMAALLLLERLSPLERAVFVLREVFLFGFTEIASAVGRSEAACRQLAVRARRHMDEGRPRFEADLQERQELAGRFFDALKEGDVQGLRELLAADVQLIGDDGGKVPMLAKVVTGGDTVARLLATILPMLMRVDVTVEPHQVNGQPGAIFRDRDDKVLNTWALDVLDGQIQTIRSVSNPDKLGHLGPVADAWAVNREANRARRSTD